ncbi:hypothetical protein B0H11DRAFT_191471 [Mycena galericulata]|nr:hypothetical protein B0H11DRAFT_191471 [Mycena galericulata]
MNAVDASLSLQIKNTWQPPLPLPDRFSFAGTDRQERTKNSNGEEPSDMIYSTMQVVHQAILSARAVRTVNFALACSARRAPGRSIARLRSMRCRRKTQRPAGCLSMASICFHFKARKWVNSLESPHHSRVASPTGLTSGFGASCPSAAIPN